MSKRGIVLGGGGAKGAYEMGVWAAMIECNITYSVVTGTSIGSINGALMVQGDYDLGFDMWQNLTPSTVMEVNTDITDSIHTLAGKKQILEFFLKDIIVKGGADTSPLEDMIHTHLDEDLIRRSPIDYGLVTVEFPRLRPVEISKQQIPKGQLPDYILASAACFPAFKTKEINGVKYIDGGYHDNVPVKLARRLGATECIVVDLNPVGKRTYFRPEERITFIQSYWSLGKALIFDNDLANRNLQLGYNDAMKVFGHYEGYLYTFYPQFNRSRAKQRAHYMGDLSQWLGLIQLKNNPLDNSIILKNKWKKFLQDRRIYTLYSDPGFLMTMSIMEACGEIYGLDPTGIYYEDQFNQLIFDAFKAKSQTRDSRAELILESAANLDDKMRGLGSLDKDALTGTIYKKIQYCRHTKRYDPDLKLLATGFFEEFLVALYLTCLEG